MSIYPKDPIESEEKYNFYQKAAKRFKAELRLSGATAAIHIENKNDEIFWGKVLKYAYPQGKFRFISGSRSYSGMMTSGCTQCLQYKDFLDEHFWIAIDSDYRYLSLEPDFDAHHYILQTYTYSFENHFCYYVNAQAAIDECLKPLDSGFNFEYFLTDYSRIIFPLLVWQLYLQDVSPGYFPKSVFHRLLTLPVGTRSIGGNAEPVIRTLKDRTRKMIAHFRRDYPEADLTWYEKRCHELGVYRDNAYLFVRGHQLYDMMIAIGRKMRTLAYDRIGNADDLSVHNFEFFLTRRLCFGQYEEIRRVIHDIHIALGLTQGNEKEKQVQANLDEQNSEE